ncbi:MAG: phosphomannomutase/phosphoglucomutase [Bacteroidales bacterium]|jgi:phosphomannomutase|nr:phosphomannomutase/phosphoglucomutase [Bacteroidales bacterium]
MNDDWKKIQNGSDIRGVALEGAAGESVNMTPKVVNTLGKAFVTWLQRQGVTKVSIAVGMDSRISGPDLKAAFKEGIISQGANVIDCNLASTPAMFMTTISDNISAQGGVMLTASHLPFNRNGLKFFTNKGGLNKKDIADILDIAEKNTFTEASTLGRAEEVDFIGEYSSILVARIRAKVNSATNYDQPLKGTKIIVDAGNGAGGFFASRVLVPLGANTEGSQFLDPDGHFPNHIPNPEDQDAMDSICQAVVDNKADLGIIFDTDVDRSAIVDSTGKPINRNALIALISAVILEEHPGSTIVTDSITSEGLATFITDELKGTHHRFKRGYKNVINESIRLNEEGSPSWLAIETSGHAALKENFFLDDGAYLVAKLLIKMAQLKTEGKNLSQLIEKLDAPLESKEFRFSISESDFLNYGNSIINSLSKQVAQTTGWEQEKVNFEGIRVKCNNTNEQGWFLLRMSLHDPVMPLNIESNIKDGVDVIKTKLKAILQGFEGIDSSML